MRDVWERLKAIRVLKFESRAAATMKTGWNGAGEGTVVVDATESTILIFREQGLWTSEDGAQNNFTNTYRWRVDWEREHIRLEHLRFGPTKPVYLFDLVMDSESTLKSENPHVCSDDLYSAQMRCEASEVLLSWVIQGPKKDVKISYCYA